MTSADVLRLRRMRSAAHGELRKPLDVGNGRAAGSFGGGGAWLSFGAPHPAHGFVELSGAPPFDEAWRADPTDVRSYRALLADDASAFVWLEIAGEVVDRRRAGVDAGGTPVWQRSGRGWSCTATARALPDRSAIVQRYVIDADHDMPSFVLNARARLDRCALAEITEVNPPVVLEMSTSLTVQGDELALSAPNLPAAARISVSAASGSWTVDGDRACWRPMPQRDEGQRREIVVTVSLDVPEWPRPQDSQAGMPAFEEQSVAFTDQDDALTLIADGAVRYTVECTAFDVGFAERAILTDHRLLPLSWTRDAYYQAALLLQRSERSPRIADIVEAHLRWLWGRGRRHGEPWMRSHLPDGRPKDLVVQADQQLYPLLELADFRRTTGRWPRPAAGGHGDFRDDWAKLISEVWCSLPRSGPAGLLAGAENPADDPSELPFALSTQILFWHTATQLATWSADLGLASLQLEQTAAQVRDAVHRDFACPGPFGSQWAYETDSAGRHRLYQDANDLPTAFAAWWGFCPADDQHWIATMRFAFSPGNPGFVSGPLGGLGSAHTPGTWTLGDAQELAVAIATGDHERARTVQDRLRHVVSVDGLLPETYDPHTGTWLARHWFAWPGSVIGLLTGAAGGTRA